jgi:hypothetical protein
VYHRRQALGVLGEHGLAKAIKATSRATSVLMVARDIEALEEFP